MQRRIYVFFIDLLLTEPTLRKNKNSYQSGPKCYIPDRCGQYREYVGLGHDEDSLKMGIYLWPLEDLVEQHPDGTQDPLGACSTAGPVTVFYQHKRLDLTLQREYLSPE